MRFDVPTPDEDTRPFWDAARHGRLLIKRCSACGRAHHYPRPFCPYCWSRDVAWQQARGTGSIYTFSVVHRNDLPPFNERVPYVAAVVELDEGPRLMTNVVDCDPADVAVGMAVEVAFRAIDDTVTIPVFRPDLGTRAPRRVPIAPSGGGVTGDATWRISPAQDDEEDFRHYPS